MATYRYMDEDRIEYEVNMTSEEEELFDRYDDGECQCGHDIMDHNETAGNSPCNVAGCSCRDFEACPCPVTFTEAAR